MPQLVLWWRKLWPPSRQSWLMVERRSRQKGELEVEARYACVSKLVCVHV